MVLADLLKIEGEYFFEILLESDNEGENSIIL